MTRDKVSDLLKIIAILTMLIDHIGAVFFPNLLIFRIVGRLSFPIFAYLLVLGYFRTSNLKRYIARLLIFGIVSQVPYTLLFGLRLNIYFTLIVGLYFIYYLDNMTSNIYDNRFLILLCTMPLTLVSDYGLYGVFTIVLFFYYLSEDVEFNRKHLIIFFTLTTLIYSIITGAYIQLFSILSLYIILNLKLKLSCKLRLNKYLAYSIYPIHLTIFYIFKVIA
ncbi:TraX family protein [Paramaledivibacter caminithermalis]|jgi:hypothetical protein|uniref:TraX protein n=1 Tax=Paramaledivibacter caminithermalis (strain DSM 15212 / CIP 107654 / DViRD3) TaxID=1121301 RepID=A0A1M6K6J4_PARC5|nr:TraX family protein [Paramaledivibacter caminithermalis]SHJ54450.1 TraX protein [Paramaledivibacter caminithermalis DSM 15212]